MIPAVLIQIDDNPNCEAWNGQVYQPQTEPQAVAQVRNERDGVEAWCDITGVDDDASLCPALACLVEDSGEGMCYLIFGGAWGLRLRQSATPWDVDNPDQWGVPYLLLSGDGKDVRWYTPRQPQDPRP